MALAPERLPADVHPESRSRLSPLKREDLSEDARAVFRARTKPAALKLAGLQGPSGVWLPATAARPSAPFCRRAPRRSPLLV
jgi:hypothetical protein